MPNAMRTRTLTPPTAPPTIAPVCGVRDVAGAGLIDGERKGEEEVGGEVEGEMRFPRPESVHLEGYFPCWL